MKLAERIVTMLEAKGIKWHGGPSNAKIHRTHAGRHQRACGAWSWVLRPKIDHDGSTYWTFPDIGSHSPASEIVKGFVVSYHKGFHDYSLDPDPDGKYQDNLPEKQS
jgi:hypothetical protein